MAQQNFYQRKLSITATDSSTLTTVKCEINKSDEEECDTTDWIGLIDFNDDDDYKIDKDEMPLFEKDEKPILLSHKNGTRSKKAKKKSNKKLTKKLDKINTDETYNRKSNSNYIDEQIKSFFQMKCELCESNFETFAEAVRHYNDAHKQSAFITCCGKKYFHRTKLFDHLMIHKNPDGIYR